MASGLHAPSLGASSITTGGIRIYSRIPQLVHHPDPIKGSDLTNSWNKIGKIQNCVTMYSRHNLKYHYKNTEGRSASQEQGERKYVVNATSEQSFEYEPLAQHPKSTWEHVKRSWDIFYRFIGPFAAINGVLSATSMSILAVEKLSDLSPAFFMGLLLAEVSSLCANIWNCGLNQLCDIELDKINKPHFPLASGEMSFSIGAVIVAASFILNCWLTLAMGSWPLFWGGVATAALTVAYNVDLPLLRWKKSAVLAATNISTYHGIVRPLGYFYHMQISVLNRPASIPRSLIFSVTIMTLLFVAISLFKDIPDIEGDEKFGVQSLSLRLGGKRVFWICISLLEMTLGAAILVGVTSPFLWSKILTVLGNAILALVVWYNAKSVDLKNKATIESFYVFIWKLVFAEYCLIPLFR